jgi:predicted enzyme related to lactoylglutathione lyase
MINTDYWNPLVPELTVRSVAESLPFYTTVGFTVRFRRSDPEFVYLELGQAQVMLEEEHIGGWHTAELTRPLGHGVNFQIEVADVTAIAAALRAAGYTLFREPKASWYAVGPDREEGQLELLVQDPEGYLLRLVEVLGARPRQETTNDDA